MRHKSLRLFLSAAILSALFASAVTAQQESDLREVSVIGTSRVSGDDVASAREAAIFDSLRGAVENVIVEITPLEAVVENFEHLTEILNEYTDQFIQGYKVLAEQRAQNRYRVLVQINVSVPALKEVLSQESVLTEKELSLKVLLCIAEQHIDDPDFRYWWQDESALQESLTTDVLLPILTQNGWVLVSPTTEISGILLAAVRDKPEISNNEGLNIGMHFEADVVILGTARSERGSNTMGTDLQTFKGVVNLRAVRVASGTEIASATRSTVIVSPDEIAGGNDAITEALRQAANDLSTQIAAAWQQAEASLNLIDLVVSGTDDLASFIQLRGAINDTAGVKEMKIKQLGIDTATLVIDFEGSAQALAEALMLKAFNSFGINIDEVTADRIKLILVPGKPAGEPKVLKETLP